MEINYNRCNVSRRIKSEIIRAKGDLFWEELTRGIIVPIDSMERRQCNMCMKVLMQRFESLLPAEEIKSIMVNVRHDLQPDDFGWAVRLFNRIGNIDRFAVELQKIGISEYFSGYAKDAQYGDPQISQRMIEYVNHCEQIFYGRRYGDVILAQAVPADLGGFLQAADEVYRHYSLCHCRFARESILQDGGRVSPLLCECSLGHTMILWETVLDCKLEGEVVESALNGGNRCLFRIKLPADVLERWT